MEWRGGGGCDGVCVDVDVVLWDREGLMGWWTDGWCMI